MTNRLKGVGVALITPFNTDGSIDYNALSNLIDFQIDNGTDYIVSLGTTGEPATMSAQEKNELLAFTIKKINKRVPLVVGCGGNNTADVLKLMQEFEKIDGIDAFLSVAPFYNKPNQNGVYQHFKTLANNTNKPILLYNVPGRTGINISVDVVIRLANECKNIIGIKEASGNVAQGMAIASRRPKDFLIISGDDALTLPLIACGFDGVISVLQNVYPAAFSKAVHLALDGKFEESKAIHYQYLDIIDTLFAEGSPSGAKAYLTQMGMIKNEVRLPLAPVSDSLFEKINSLRVKING